MLADSREVEVEEGSTRTEADTTSISSPCLLALQIPTALLRRTHRLGLRTLANPARIIVAAAGEETVAFIHMPGVKCQLLMVRKKKQSYAPHLGLGE